MKLWLKLLGKFRWAHLRLLTYRKKKIDLCQVNLRVWNHETFGHAHINLEKNLKELHRAEEMGLYSTDPDCIGQLRDDIQSLKLKEETMWKQRSHNNWLKDGDNNTKFL